MGLLGEPSLGELSSHSTYVLSGYVIALRLDDGPVCRVEVSRLGCVLSILEVQGGGGVFSGIH